MEPKIVKAAELKEYLTPERCFIYENWGLVAANDPAVSIARARLEPVKQQKPITKRCAGNLC
jgi:hypothetical protein